MGRRSDEVRMLSRALDQAGDVLAAVHADDLVKSTPCADWTVERVVGHLMADADNFRAMVGGGRPDWSAAPEVEPGWAESFRERADDLLHAWHRLGEGEAAVGPGMAVAEFAVHTWDLARALGRGDKGLDPEVARHALAFLQANLADDRRGVAFGPALPAPADAGPYERLASFTGRTVA